MSRGQRIGFLAAGAAIAVLTIVLVVSSSGGDDSGSPAATGPTGTSASAPAGEESPSARGSDGREPASDVTRIDVENGSPVGGIEELQLDKGDEVRFEVSSDASDEVHVHGYELLEDVGPGEPAKFDFAASLDGVYEVELHGSGTQIAELKVSP